MPLRQHAYGRPQPLMARRQAWEQAGQAPRQADHPHSILSFRRLTESALQQHQISQQCSITTGKTGQRSSECDQLRLNDGLQLQWGLN